MSTLKQKAVVKKLVGSGGSMTVSEAMREVGYSENTIDTPTKLTEAKGFNELLNQYLPDSKVLATHEAGLEATKQLSVRGGNANAESDDFIEVPDHPTRLKAVELAYKVKGKMNSTTVAVQVNNITPEQLKDDELDAIIS